MGKLMIEVMEFIYQGLATLSRYRFVFVLFSLLTIIIEIVLLGFYLMKTKCIPMILVSFRL